MPRTAHCPTCDTNVKVPDAAKRGSLVRCPSCDETFQPPFLKPVEVVDEEDTEPYDPYTAERYGIKKAKPGERARAAEDDAKEEVRKEIRRERQRPKFAKPSRGLFGGVEGFFLLSGLLLAVGIPVAFFGVRRRTEWSPMLAGGVVVGVCFVLFLIGFLAKAELRARFFDWFWGTNRRD